MQDKAARFANFLLAQGVKKGDKVAGLLPRNIELLITVFATWRIGAVYQPLFTAFGPKAIEHRLEQLRRQSGGDRRGQSLETR